MIIKVDFRDQGMWIETQTEAEVRLGRDLGDLELGQMLPVALHPAVMLLRLHLVNEDLGPLLLFEDLGLNSHTLEEGLANGEVTVVLGGQNAPELNLGANLSLERV